MPGPSLLLLLLLPLLLLGLLGCLRAEPVFDESGRLNVSASCPMAACRLSELHSNFQQPLRCAGGQMGRLEELLLENCRLRALPVELLRLAPNLRQLLVHNGSVPHLSREDFQATPELRQLLLQRNHISRLREQQFATLQRLQVLQLNNNQIRLVHGQAFAGLAQLQLLSLQGNGIAELAAGTFEPLANLTHLDLSDNEIGEISAQTFAQNEQLQTLLLARNQLAQFAPSALAALTKLRLLDLSNCGRLAELRLHSVQRLLVEDSDLRRLVIDGGVISLLAGRNALTQLAIGDKSAVIELDLHANQLNGSAVVALLQGMWSLQRLDLGQNNIESLTDAGNGSTLRLQLPSLTQLSLARNQLRSLPLLLLPAQLVRLDISFNHMLEATAQSFGALLSLQSLLMEGNRLRQFDVELFHLQHPRVLELGICDADAGYALMHRMLLYLSDRHVHSPVHCPHKPSSSGDNSASLAMEPAAPEAQTRFAGVAGIHPYWTTRDVLAFLTLLVVFIILLMQLYHILQEEGCLRRLRQRFLGRPPVVANGHRARRLNEADSESSSE